MVTAEVCSAGEERKKEKLLHFVCDSGNQEQSSSEDLRVLADSYRTSKSEMYLGPGPFRAL